MTDADEAARLRAELDRAYSQMAEITSRLLAVNEAGDLFVSSHDQEALAASLLEVSARTVRASSGAVFLSQGEGAFHTLATHGLSDDLAEQIAASLPDLAICQLVEDEGRTLDATEAGATESFAGWVEEQKSEDAAAQVEPRLELFVPLAIEGRSLGVLALGARPGHARYTDEDRAVLEHLCAQGALALDRGLLFSENEERIKDLDALLRISREMTSTLDLDHVMLTAVNTTAAIVERERAVLALEEGGKLVVRAVSDFPRVDSGTAERLGLKRLLEWLSIKHPDRLCVTAAEVDANPELEGREVLRGYFSGDMRALLVLGLKDDQGHLGCLLLESFHQNAFVREGDRDALTVLAGQLSTAIRNADLYRHLPMVGALAPLAQKRQSWNRLSPGKKRRWIAGAVALVVVVGLIRWPRAVGGEAQVLPVTEVPVRATTAGILRSIDVEPGQAVTAGQLLARLDEAPAGARVAELRAQAAQARGQAAEAERERDPLARRLADLRRDAAMARLTAAEREGGGTALVAPVDGYVLTPALASMQGSYLDAGEVFCHVSPLDTVKVEAAVQETEIDDVRPGQRLRIKVLGFPDRQFKGRVTEVSWQGEPRKAGAPSVFLVRGWVANPGPRLRSGMTGRARVDVSGATLLGRWGRGLYRAIRLGLWI